MGSCRWIMWAGGPLAIALLLGPGPALGADAVFEEAAFDDALGDRIPPDLALSPCIAPGPFDGEAFEGLGMRLSSPSPVLCVEDADLGPGVALPQGSHTFIFAYGQEAVALSPIELGDGGASLGISAFSFASPVETLESQVPGLYLGLLFDGSQGYITFEVPEGGLTLWGMTFLGADKDLDGYGHLEGQGGGDCDDGDPEVYPGAEEIPYNGRDEDCDGGDLQDVDGDGQLPLIFGGADCDDRDPEVYTGAEEVLDGVDNNCNGRIDEGTTAYDDDRDGYSEGEGDCDDDDPESSPEGVEIPYDGIDQDCSGADLTDVDGDGFDGGPEGEDCNDAVDYIYPGALEYCGDGVDEDCDGEALLCPTPSPSSAPSPSPGPSSTPSPGASPSLTPSPSLSSSPSPSLPPSPSPSASPPPSLTSYISPTPSPSPLPTASALPSPTPAPTRPPCTTTTAPGTEIPPVDATPKSCGDCGGGGGALLFLGLIGAFRRPKGPLPPSGWPR